MEFVGPREDGGMRRRQAPKRRVILNLQALEERWAPAGMTKLGQWNNGTAWYSDGWAATQNGRDYAYIGHYGNNNGIHIVDITNPASPFLVSNFKTASGWNDFRDVEIEQKSARRSFGFFSSDSGGGVVVANVSNPANPVEIFRITSAHQGHNNVHTLSVDGNYLFEADSRSDVIKVFDIKNPASPKFVRNIVTVTDAVHEVTAINGRLYAAGIFGSPRVEIFDISQVGNTAVPVTKLGTVFSGTWAHTAWPTEDGNFVAVAHERQSGELSFWDITNPSSPQLAWSISLPTNQAYSVHQVMIKGDKLYASWYQAGIRVYDISNRFNPVLLGDYDTYSNPVDGFNGAWGVYPFLGDGKILGFDMLGGIFLLSLDNRSNDGGGSHSHVVATSDANEVKPSVSLVGDIVRVLLDDEGHEVSVSSNESAGTLDVSIDGGEVFQFDLDAVTRINIYGGAGNDRFVFDPDIVQAINVDGGDGDDSVAGWPAIFGNTSDFVSPDHCAQVMGVNRGNHYDTQSVELFEGTAFNSSTLLTSALTGHASHSTRAFGPAWNGSSVVASDHMSGMSGMSNAGMGATDPLMSGMMASFHAGGKIAPELMVRSSTNSQVGGQVAYHKPG